MSTTLLHCALRSTRTRRYSLYHQRSFATGRSTSSTQGRTLNESEVDDFLSKPTWSVRSLLPPSGPSATDAAPEVTPKQLRHLLRLSALPAPKDQEQESGMLRTLSAQLHFVKAIQQIDTTDVEPLRSLRDETAAARQEHTYDMESMRDTLAQEEVVGKWHRRIRRKPHDDADGKTEDSQDWDVLGNADRKVGKFFVVEGAPREE